jgi:hypothetical protein
VSELPELPTTNANDRRNIATGFVLRRIPDGHPITVAKLEALVRSDFEPCGREHRIFLGTLKEWYRYQSFCSFMGKLNTKGYIALESNGKKLSSMKAINDRTMVSRGRNYGHYANDPKGIVAVYLKTFEIPLLDRLASL